MASFRFVQERARRSVSRLLSFVVKDSFRFNVKWRCLRFMYKLFCKRVPVKVPRLICYYRDGSRDCPGLADRLKAMVTGYIIAAENGRPFYIYHDHGFLLEDYLVPAMVDWHIEHEEINVGLFNCRRLWFSDRLVKLSPRVAEYHSLGGGDITMNLSGDLKDKYDFSRMFHRLFRLSSSLQHHLDELCSQYDLQEDSFIAVHVRFLDFFDTVESGQETAYTRHASSQEQAAMIDSVNYTITQLQKRHLGKRVLLFADSPTFMVAEHPKGVITLPGEIGHIHSHPGNNAVTLKAFLDMFTMARASHIYSIIGPGIHSSGFSYMSARIGGKSFERVERLVEC